MEEVDSIIIHSLRQVGCDIEEDVESLKNFSTELVIEAAVRCLDVIQPGLGLPHSLPDSMSTRFRVGASIAQACKNLGYSGDIGYQTFLYSSETDVRRVFVFLIEKLPKESEKNIVEPTGRIGLLEKAVSEAVKKQLTSPWLPRYCKRRGIRWYDDGTWSREGCCYNQPFVSCNIHVPKTTNSKELSQAWREYHFYTITCLLCSSVITEEKSHEEQMLKNKEEQQIVKKRTYGLLPEADTNLSALQTSVDSSAQNLVTLALQWEKHRVPLLTQYRDARERNSSIATESQKKVDASRKLREKSRELGEEVRHKEQLHSQLVIEYEKVTKDINRSAYTRRIMEIIGNICKQKEEIDKVLKDTKKLQKMINNLTGQLERSFTVADELIFRDAKRDETARKAYKLLATLHSDCSELVQMVEETGAIVREIRDLEEQIETESAKNVGANLNRISADLRQMKQESAALTAQLNAKS
ncbi:coiled-coil domain-containing protein 22 homolog [Zootermopsis nevadensis]|uniref:coiled-coil domain-containing protein 22 homolog n=1 Tax=Zootermopsis nevadensis TaxID=136037 RepID=UPI000B8EBE40|nr:coiled-coil domain-containing protein 22 homolog [Zootermopsis nevadensis]